MPGKEKAPRREYSEMVVARGIFGGVRGAVRNPPVCLSAGFVHHLLAIFEDLVFLKVFFPKSNETPCSLRLYIALLYNEIISI